jgi:hypothetical protein
VSIDYEQTCVHTQTVIDVLLQQRRSISIPPSDMIDGDDVTRGWLDQNDVPLATDQRGFLRPVGLRFDVDASNIRT